MPRSFPAGILSAFKPFAGGIEGFLRDSKPAVGGRGGHPAGPGVWTQSPALLEMDAGLEGILTRDLGGVIVCDLRWGIRCQIPPSFPLGTHILQILISFFSPSSEHWEPVSLLIAGGGGGVGVGWGVGVNEKQESWRQSRPCHQLAAPPWVLCLSGPRWLTY